MQMVVGNAFTREAVSLFGRFTTPPTYKRAVIINNLIVSLLAAGVWQKLDVLYVMGAADAQAARQNWISSSSNLTAVSSPTFTTDRGYQGNGTSSYLSTGYNPGDGGSHNFTLNDAHMAVWSLTDGQQTTVEFGARTGASVNEANMIVRSTDGVSGAFYARLNQNSGVPAVSNTNGTGHLLQRRTSSTAMGAFRNGSSLGTMSQASTGVPNFEMFVLARNSGGTPNTFSTRQLMAAHAGASLTDTEIAQTYAALDTYRAGIGA